MRFSGVRFAALTLILLWTTAGSVFGQALGNPQTDKGFFQYSSLSIAHDSSADWISEMGVAVGYDFNRRVSIESGIPFYFVQTTDSGGSNTQTSRGLGDWFGRIIYTPINKPFHYATALTGTAPTGDQDLGISPGSPTWTWLNRFDKQFSRYTPFVELGLTNSISGDRRYQRSFTTLGNAATFRGGLALDLWKFTSAEFSGYGVQGLGSQKVYSRKVAAGAASSASSQMGRRPFDTQHLTSGDSALADDHGFNTSFYVSPMPRLDIGISYNRSTSFELNTVSASIGYRFGHMQNASSRK